MRNDHNDQEGKIKECATSRMLLDSAGIEDERFSAYMASHFAFRSIISSQPINEMFNRMVPEPEDVSARSRESLERVLQADLNAVSIQPKVRDDDSSGNKVSWHVTINPMDI